MLFLHILCVITLIIKSLTYIITLYLFFTCVIASIDYKWFFKMYDYDIDYTKLFCEFRIERNNYAWKRFDTFIIIITHI